MSETQNDSLSSIAAIAIAAACLTTFAHEGFGHGGACLAIGGHITLLTSVYFSCQPSPWWIAIAGPAGNLLWAVIAWLALQRASGALRLLLAFSMMFSLFWEAGYLLFASVTLDGDYYFAARDVFGAVTLPIRITGGAAGLALYVVAMRMARAALQPFADPGRVRRIVRIAWIAAALATTAAAAFYAPDRLGAMRQAALELGAASLPMLMLGREMTGGGGAGMRLNGAWLAAAAIAYVIFAATLGRSVSL